VPKVVGLRFHLNDAQNGVILADGSNFSGEVVEGDLPNATVSPPMA
jgi:hypothetical protein